ncbi:MAG: response regulator transcription factor [Deltaproteobacteria bacterium]|nr:response regulator transcription factor [Deltaproteobacteria bacterium]
MGHKILLVEDEHLVGTMVRLNMESEGHEVTWCRTAPAALEEATGQPFDLVLLDIGLPGGDGLAVLSEMRKRGIGTPVMMLTARGDVASKVQALDIGADDYLGKPFDVAELIARAGALIRRSRADREVPADQVVRFDAYEVNLATREAVTSQGRVTLSEKEAAFLAMLVRARGATLTRNDILEEVWGMDVTPTQRTVDNVVLRLRKLFEPNPDEPVHILTVRGAGYRFEP